MNMTTDLNVGRFQLLAGDLRFTFLNSGDLYEASYKTTMINQWLSNPIDGSLNNLYLRLYRPDGLKIFPLLGIRSGSRVRFAETQAVWEGAAEDVAYRVTLTLTEEGIWFWDVTVDGSNTENCVEADVIYGQDIGIADPGAVRSNEAYLSQYIDHSVYEDEKRGYILVSRQNQRQQSGFPYLQQGAITGAIGYATDGFQFFGLSYKETNRPEALDRLSLPSEVLQYEFAFTTLQSKKVSLRGKAQFLFYGLLKENHPEAVTSAEYEEELMAAWEKVKAYGQQNLIPVPKVTLSDTIGSPLQALPMTRHEIDRWFPSRLLEEREGDQLLSFFTETYAHVVLREKELLVERPHGHIVMSGNNDHLVENVLTSTSYMYGVINSQLVVGNTSFNKMLTNTRNPLNIMKTSGQRIYVEMDGVYRLLSLPSMFEIGLNYTRWFYKTADDLLVITNYTIVDAPELRLEVRSESGKAYRFLVTHQVIVDTGEYETSFGLERDGQSVRFTADPKAMNASVYPQLTYRMYVEGAQFSLTDERRFSPEMTPRSASLVVFELDATSSWSMTIQGLLYGEDLPVTSRSADAEIERYRRFIRNLMNDFRLSLSGTEGLEDRNSIGDYAEPLERKMLDTVGGDGDIVDREKEYTAVHPSDPEERVESSFKGHVGADSEEIEKLNAIAWWYTHQMLVHYSVPHGLEQYGGAAWGTRDVCQGPAEYFLAMQKYESVREILLTVYAHQFADDGNWPQWFMFDRYEKIQAGDSHGDIIVWPLKVLGDYLAQTKDDSILREKVPYTVRGSFEQTEERETILHHVKKAIAYIQNHFLHDTHLSSYGEGDWDDTLQPANAQLREYMVSSWTVALTYQALRQLSQGLEKEDGKEAEQIKALAAGIKEDFSRYILSAGVIPGFLYLEDPTMPKRMLHPEDTETGIHYRLLPMTRSMISELLTPEEAEKHYRIIKEKLFFPDGVRLMNRPAAYQGGVSVHFRRAEQAANFGREIGLMYVHAHIRFVEAMAKLGKAEEAWHGLMAVNPIKIRDVVPNAERRQSNTYFSSSDGKFRTRYEAERQFHQLYEGGIPVKAGWRIYSSGPGIYMNQLISQVFGIRRLERGLVIDPVMPDRMNGLKLDFRVMNRPITVIYHFDQGDRRIKINGEDVPARSLHNPYRRGGYHIAEKELSARLTSESNQIDVYL